MLYLSISFPGDFFTFSPYIYTDICSHYFSNWKARLVAFVENIESLFKLLEVELLQLNCCVVKYERG